MLSYVMVCCVMLCYLLLGSLEQFYNMEQVTPEARSKLHDIGVSVLDDLHYVTYDDYVRAGLSVVASRKLVAKVSRHKPD